MQSLEILISEIESSQQKINDTFKDYIKQYLVEHPEIPGIGIIGYTPSFNDGEPCRFEMLIDDDPDLFLDIEGIPKRIRVAYDKYMESMSNSDSPIHRIEFERILSNEHVSKAIIKKYDEYGFLVFYYLNGGNLVEVREDYDCGY